jgi:hypothetical protein
MSTNLDIHKIQIKSRRGVPNAKIESKIDIKLFEEHG